MNDQSPGPVLWLHDVLFDIDDNALAESVEPLGTGTEEANQRLLAAAYTAFDKAGRELGVDAVKLAETIDLAQLAKWAHAVVACHAAMSPGDAETPLDSAIYGLSKVVPRI